MARKRGRRRWLRWGIFLLSAVLLLFLGLQGLLATPWACGQVAARIEKRIGLETRIKRLSWSPWGGAAVHGLTVAKPEGLDDRPLIDVARVRVWPDYAAWIRGRRELRGVEVVEPKVELDVGLLMSLASQLLPEAPEPPALAVVEPRPEPGAAGGPRPDPAAPPAVAEVPEPPSKPTPPQPEPPASGPEARSASWLTIRKAECRVIMPGGGDLLRLEGWDGAVPISGAGAGRLSGLCLSDFADDLGMNPSLRLESLSSGAFSLDLKASGEKAEVTIQQKFSRNKGMPFQARVSVLIREAVEWRAGEDWSGSLDTGRGDFEILGWLLHPGTWTARGGWRSTGLELAAGGWRMDFDRVSAGMVLSGGRVQCPDFRLLGSSVSLLGNGWLGRGSGAAVVRITLPPAWAEGVGEQLGGVAWRPLLPGNLLHADLTLWLDQDGRWRVELGEGGPVRDWNEWKACLSGSPAGGR